MSRSEITEFYRVIPNEFSDSLTGGKPNSERELMAVLSLKHQAKRMRWENIPIITITKEKDCNAPNLINDNDYAISEYPLFTKSKEQVDRWGQMSADLVFINPEYSRVCFIEAKVDSKFTHSDNPPDGQLSRYMEYLESLIIKQKNLVVITPKCNLDWYSDKLNKAVSAVEYAVGAHIILWEDVFINTKG